MGNANRVVGYLGSVASASLFYMVWFTVESELSVKGGTHVGTLFHIAFALFFLVFEGMGAAFALMALPWYCAVNCYERLRRFGSIYFSLFGAAMILLIGCGTSSVSPKPLFIEDQTFLQGCVIAFERQGLCLSLTGLVFGLTFWLISERLRYPEE